tara:strand:+ start:244 stop:540 length:297 start_codon:yes stop_codon:yes gene_type:complete
MKTKEIGFFLLILLFLNGCVQSTAFLGPAFTVASTGDVYTAGLQYGAGKVVKKKTGKEPMEVISDKLKGRKKINKDFINLVKKHVEKNNKLLNKKDIN